MSRIFFLSEGPSPPDFAERGYDPWSWYTVSEVDTEGRIESGFVTYDQGELLRYFAKRHRKGEQLRLLKISLTQTGLLGKEDNVGFVYVLNRTARDLEPGLGGPARIASGQGAINCKNRRIFAWRMDMKAEDERTAREAATGCVPTRPAGSRAKPSSRVHEERYQVERQGRGSVRDVYPRVWSGAPCLEPVSHC